MQLFASQNKDVGLLVAYEIAASTDAIGYY